MWIFHQVPVLPVHLQEAPEVVPKSPCSQKPDQLGTDVWVEGPVLQQGADKVDQLRVQDPGVLALDDIFPDNNNYQLMGWEWLNT